MKVVTSRAVRKGEELCDNYGSSWGGGQRLRIIIILIMIGGQGLRERRKALSADYGFTCTCVACAAEEKEEVERFQEAAKRSLIQPDKKAPSKELSNESCERRSVDTLNDIWKEYKKSQEFAWKEGNLRIDNLRK